MPKGIPDHANRARIGATIRTRRRSLNLSQVEVATECEVSRASVSQWEAGTMDVDASRLVVLAKVLQTTVGGLLGEEVSPEVVSVPDGRAHVESDEQRLLSLFRYSTDEDRERLIAIAQVLITQTSMRAINAGRPGSIRAMSEEEIND